MTRDEACAVLEWVLDNARLPIAAQLEVMEVQGCIRGDEWEEEE